MKGESFLYDLHPSLPLFLSFIPCVLLSHSLALSLSIISLLKQWIKSHLGHAVAQAGFPPRQPGSGYVGYVVDKAALGQVMWDTWWTKRHWARLCGIRGGQSGTGPGFLRVRRISPAKCSADCSTLIIIWGWYSGSAMDSVIVNLVPLHPLSKEQSHVCPSVSNI
jgi:hypothetical protein